MITLRRLSPDDVSAYRRLRLRGLRESPTAFGSSYAEEAKLSLGTLMARLEPAAGKWVFGAFAGQRLVGVVTLIRESRRKERHKASIYGMYVEAAQRQNGVGRRLMDRVIETARQMRGLKHIKLAVVESNRAALRLYGGFEFKGYGREQDALYVKGTYYSFLFMVRRL